MIIELLATIVIIFLAELADKTQLVIFSLGIKYRKPLQVFSGALLAHGIMDGIAIVAGSLVASFFKIAFLKVGIAALFILIGIYMIFKEKKTKKVPPLIKNVFLAAFALIFLSEFGDKSQIAAGLLGAKYNLPLIVFAGTMLGLALAIGLNLLLGKRIAKFIGYEKAEKIAAGLFIVYGIIFLLL
ncbi:TPA: TMEM165/GDT1 family protein [archaeon]|uniref:TMEM165/GDT1 family protein n=1 Tax=Candidatus Naiadarchaeum limnaeum TaxID=2756139 RepID=A0A832V1A3_9ARCH|nr:TMEM165/GDT1 family protein [Candidatus Naiadarchaeum limnaeum]